MARRPWYVVGLLLTAVAIAAATLLTTGDDEATTPTTVPPAVSAAVWPASQDAITSRDPVAAARGFAVDFVGFVDPVVGRFQQGDSRSGEVEIRPTPSGPVTTVFVRQLGSDDAWSVLGSATASIDLRSPGALEEINSPVRLQGAATAFEATVRSEVREDGNRKPLGSGFVMGGSMGTMGPFVGILPFSRPSTPAGAVVLFTVSMENGRVWEASVVRVRFAPGDCARAAPVTTPEADEMVVAAFFTCSKAAGGSPVAVPRVVPRSAGVLRAALGQLLAGPTERERADGFASFFSSATAGMLAGVEVRDGAAVVDFHDLRPVIPNASSSAGSQQLLAELDATVFQLASVRSVVYRIEGDCEAFSEWLQYGGCEPKTRPR